MSNKNQQGNAAVSLPREEQTESGLTQLRAEVDQLRSSFASLAMMLMPHHLRRFCACGKIACGTVDATKPGLYDVKSFAICENCTLPEGWRESARIALGPAERETVRLANSLGCIKP